MPVDIVRGTHIEEQASTQVPEQNAKLEADLRNKVNQGHAAEQEAQSPQGQEYINKIMTHISAAIDRLTDPDVVMDNAEEQKLIGAVKGQRMLLKDMGGKILVGKLCAARLAKMEIGA